MPGAPRTNPAAPPRGAQADLAARLRQGAEVLLERLNNSESVVQLIRSVSQILEPHKVADVLLAHAQEWFPASCLAVAVNEETTGMSLIAERGPSQSFGEPLLKIASWITAHNAEFMSANLRTDRRVAGGPEASVVGFPLRARARTLGALIVLDPAPSSEEPQLPAALQAWLRTILEMPALALDTAMQLQRVEAL
jgi:GAF domain-containing protein